MRHRPLKGLIMPLTFMMVYPMMVTLQRRKIVEGGDLKVQVVTQLLNFTVIPLCALLIGKLFFPDSPDAALGLLLASLLPTSGMTISWTGMARGNVADAIKITVFGLLIGSERPPPRRSPMNIDESNDADRALRHGRALLGGALRDCHLPFLRDAFAGCRARTHDRDPGAA